MNPPSAPADPAAANPAPADPAAADLAAYARSIAVVNYYYGIEETGIADIARRKVKIKAKKAEIEAMRKAMKELGVIPEMREMKAELRTMRKNLKRKRLLVSNETDSDESDSDDSHVSKKSGSGSDLSEPDLRDNDVVYAQQVKDDFDE